MPSSFKEVYFEPYSKYWWIIKKVKITIGYRSKHLSDGAT